MEGIITVHDEAHLRGLWECLKICFPDLFLRVERLENFLDVSSELVAIFWGPIEYDYDVHVAGFFLWGSIEIPFV